MKKKLKVALVHDYLKEYGGAERVLQNLCEIYPQAPIYTAFCVKNSTAGKAFANAKIIESKFAFLIKHKNLYSPLRFLTPLIWKSFNLSRYDLVIASSSWMITRGFRVGPNTKVICYCHTPPRYLYGYPTSIEWRRYLLVRIYASVINHFLRLFDFKSAWKVDYFIVNSKNVQNRVKKFYRRDSTIIYPPVEVNKIIKATWKIKKPDNFFLIASRIVGAKGIEVAIEASKLAGIKIKIIGEPAGLKWLGGTIENKKNANVEFLGRLSDEKLYEYYGKCKAFLALSTDEDFGMTPVEAMAAGRPVIAYRGGGYLETVVEGKTGVFFEDLSAEGLVRAIEDFEKVKNKIKPDDCRKQAEKFSKERFKEEIENFVKKITA